MVCEGKDEIINKQAYSFMQNETALNFHVTSAKISLLVVCDSKDEILDKRECRFTKIKLHYIFHS